MRRVGFRETGLAMTTARDSEPKPLFYESGASWWWLMSGPAAAVSMILIEGLACSACG